MTTLNAVQKFASEHQNVVIGFAAVGLLGLASKVLLFLKVIAETFVLSGTRLSKYGAKKGAFALVTGATDGIGREFALQLAQAGFGIVLVSRTREKLQKLAQEIEDKYKVPTRIQVIDFANADQQSAYGELAYLISDIEVGVLVNNVGKSHDVPVYFTEGSQQEMEAIIRVNINGTLNITKVVLPGMIERKRGLILNIGSMAGQVPSPMLATYSGSKAFIRFWSIALAEECKKHGVAVQLLNTFYVVSNMSKIRRPSLVVPTAKAYVRSALSKLQLAGGASGKPYTSTPFWAHSILDWFVALSNMPQFWITYSLNSHIDIRRRALKRQAREAGKQE